MPDTSVKYFNSTMSGAPALSGTAGALISVLDACLVTGFGTATLSSLVVAGNVATGTVNGGHNLAMYAAGAGPVIRVAGATPSALNGDWRLASVPGATTFTFATTGIGDQTATGTITAARAPAGFAKAYSGTDKAAYRANAETSTRLYLRVNDSPAQYPTVVMYETMSDVDTGTGPGPTSGTYYTAKSIAASSATRPWRLYADHAMMTLFIDSYSNGYYTSGLTFGDIISYAPADAYRCILIAHAAANQNYANIARLNDSAASLIARSYSQTGGVVSQLRYSHYLSTASVGLAKAGNAYPAAVDNGFHAWPVECWQSSTVLRGLMPGLWNPLHTTNPPDGTVIESIPQLPGRALFIQTAIDNTYRCAIDITGPWR